MKQTFFLAITLVSMAACTTVKRSRTVKTTNIYGPGIIHLPVVADMDVEEKKINGQSEGRTGKSIEVLKLDAIADALKQSNADVLVEPIFETEIDGTKIRVKVTGYPARYSNFRKMVPTDTLFLVPGWQQKPHTVDPGLEKKKKKNEVILQL